MYTAKAESLAKRFHGTVVSAKKCVPFLNPETTFLFGISFSDPKANYQLLSPYDLMNLAPATRAKCQETKTSPFDNLLLIVFKTKEGEISFKLINGMASILLEEMLHFCEQKCTPNTPT